MVYALMHGNLLGAARFNALGLAAVVLLMWAYFAWTYGHLVGRRIRSWQHHRWAAAVTLSLVLAWFVVRNIPADHHDRGPRGVRTSRRAPRWCSCSARRPPSRCRR
ncbi:hypothetical protein [Mycobacterium avium]|uniref:hypothetical protein n=1 Tax=Mycobacterium avium TaxID=1764 RepID=UPI002F263E09